MKALMAAKTATSSSCVHTVLAWERCGSGAAGLDPSLAMGHLQLGTASAGLTGAASSNAGLLHFDLSHVALVAAIMIALRQ